MRTRVFAQAWVILSLGLWSCVQMPSMNENRATIQNVRMKTDRTRLEYPPAVKSDVVDDYFGTSVPDPFRGLEVHDSAETREWVRAENALTESFLNRPEREAIRKRLRQLYDFPRVSTPSRHGSRYFFNRNEGLQNQPLFYVQEGLRGSPRLVLDPNSLSEDGTVAVNAFSPSSDGRLVGYSISRSGSDRVEIQVRDVDSGKDLSDRIEWAKFTNIEWTPDDKGFYYTRYPVPGTVPAGDEHYFPKLVYHRLGDSQNADRVIYERPGEREVTFGGTVSHDGEYLIVSVFRGSADESEVFLQRRGSSRFQPLFTGFENIYKVANVLDDVVYLVTNEGAPFRRVIAIELGKTNKVREIVPQGKDLLEEVKIINRKLVAHYLHNASSLIRIFDLNGKLVSEVDLPGIGSVPESDDGRDIHGEVNGEEMFISFESYVRPPTNFVYDFKSEALSVFNAPEVKFNPDEFETEQVWFPSKDGTPVSMFLSHRKGMKKDGNAPVFLYGYGGFNIAQTPAFNPPHFFFVEKGGIFAVVNLRGGSEYGEEWHTAGMLDKKQNVFDDFAAAGDWLIRSGYTRKERLAVSGRSNGGLLAAASVVQRPDLFQAAVVQVPVVDMLRYHRFTVARFWIPEYGSSENEEQFRFLYAYSPLHNIKDEVHYPATLITTADTDDRVDPGPAKKFAARLQEAQGGEAPVLIRIDTKAGHASGSLGGAGKPISKLIEEWGDIWTFVFAQLGMSPNPAT